LANLDWRDRLVEAGFAEDVTAHDSWRPEIHLVFLRVLEPTPNSARGSSSRKELLDKPARSATLAAMTSPRDPRFPLAEILLVAMVTIGSAAVGAGLGWYFVYGFAATIGRSLDWPLFVEHPRPVAAVTLGFLAAAGTILSRVQDIRRATGRRQCARTRGLEYHRGGDPSVTSQLDGCLGRESMVRYHHGVTATENGGRVALCDRSYQSGSSNQEGGNRRTVKETVSFFESDALDLPAFELRPEGFFVNLVMSIAGARDLDFEDHTEFSRAYHLSGADEPTIRRLFGEGMLLDLLADPPGLHLRRGGQRVAFYRSKKRVPTRDLDAALEEIRELRRAFEQASEC